MSEPAEPADAASAPAEPAPADAASAPAVDAPNPAAPRGGPLVALRPLRHRSFGLLWSGGLISVVGSWMQTVAVGALVISRTGKASWAVIVAAAAFLPIGLLSPLGGALADRIPRRAALVTGNLVAGAVALVIALLVAGGHDSPALLSGLVAVQGCVSALTGPFQAAILPDLVPRDEFLAAASLGSAQFNLGRVIGPAVAGASIAAFGYPVAFVANAISFLAVVVALAFVPLPPPPGRESRSSVGAALRQGVEAARSQPACRAAISTIAVVALLASPFIALVPAMAGHVAHHGARAIASATGVLTTAQGVGAVTGALVLAPLAARAGRGKVLVGSLVLLPAVLVAYGAGDTLVWATVGLFGVGFVYMGVLSGLQTVVQLSAPADYRGRILSFYLVALGVGYPIGSLVQGPLADRIGLGWTTATTAGALVVVMLVATSLRPGYWKPLLARLPGESGALRMAVPAGTPIAGDAGGAAVPVEIRRGGLATD
jgi:MFS family permease